jgi:hypothetical protein
VRTFRRAPARYLHRGDVVRMGRGPEGCWTLTYEPKFEGHSVTLYARDDTGREHVRTLNEYDPLYHETVPGEPEWFDGDWDHWYEP